MVNESTVAWSHNNPPTDGRLIARFEPGDGHSGERMVFFDTKLQRWFDQHAHAVKPPTMWREDWVCQKVNQKGFPGINQA